VLLGFLLVGSPVTPLSRASTSSWERKSWAMAGDPLLHDELVEQHGEHRPVVFGAVALVLLLGVGSVAEHVVGLFLDLVGELSRPSAVASSEGFLDDSSMMMRCFSSGM
jgi:hypothetical protein